MTPRQHRIAYQIKWLIDSTAGECTLHDMAELTGASWQACRRACGQKGWNGMYRRTMRDTDKSGNWGSHRFSLIQKHDTALEALWGPQ